MAHTWENELEWHISGRSLKLRWSGTHLGEVRPEEEAGLGGVSGDAQLFAPLPGVPVGFAQPAQVRREVLRVQPV